MPPSDLAPGCDCPHCGTPWQTYASLFQHNPQPMWVFDRRTLRFLEVNRAAVARYGYSREEFLSRTLFDIRPQEDADLLLAELSKWEQLEGPYSCQWRHQLRDGLLRAAERQAEALSRDLEVERRRLRDVFESAPGFIALVRGPDHVFDVVNAAYRELVGMDPVGRPIREVVPELEAQGVFALLNHVYRTGEAVSGDEARVVLARADRRQDERFVRFVWEPLIDARGRIEGVLAHGVDMTPQVQARRELQRLARDQRNALRALRLSEERFALLSHNTVLEACNGEEALRIFDERGGDIDLILTDMVMPGMSGRDLARRLLPRAPAIPVIFMSGYTEEILGGEDLMRDSTFLEKPFAPAALTAAVRSSLSSRRSARNTQPA
jgi:PAS domain S-box-containing protein